MLEAMPLPKEWVERSADVDEIWVPSTFVRDLFLSGGVSRSKVLVVSEPIDASLYDPERITVRSSCWRLVDLISG